MKPNRNENDFPVICVGGSAGGLDAYTRLLRHLPADLGAAIVIVNHLRTVATRLHEILPSYTEMPVELITEGLDIRPDHVFGLQFFANCECPTKLDRIRTQIGNAFEQRRERALRESHQHQRL